MKTYLVKCQYEELLRHTAKLEVEAETEEEACAAAKRLDDAGMVDFEEEEIQYTDEADYAVIEEVTTVMNNQE